MRTSLAVVLAAGLVLGGGAPPDPGPAPSGPVSDPVPAPPPDAVPDLDFSEDFPAPGRPGHAHAPAHPGGQVTQTLPTPPTAARGPSRSWVYWTAGMTALAAGGAAWYLHSGGRPAPVRHDQVFTDEAD